MIETLHGMQEIVNFKENTKIRLYDNDKFESYPMHWHTPLEIIMPLKNGYHVECNHMIYDLCEGDVLLIPPGTIHSMVAPQTGKRLIFQADFTMLDNIQELQATLSLISPSLMITPENASAILPQIQHLLLNISKEYFSEAPLIEASIYAKLIEILVLLGRDYALNTQFHNKATKQREYTEKFFFICNYINSHFCENITLDELANIAGFSKYHFSRLFKHFTNVSFYKYVNNQRISYAEKLLLNQELSITDIALQSGFNSPSTFIRMFKIIKGCTPTEFKCMYTA